MKNTFKIKTLALAVGLLIPIFASAQMSNEKGYYVGGNVGFSKFYKTDTGSLLNVSKADTSAVGLGGSFGYGFGDGWAIESGFNWLGQLKYKDTQNIKVNMFTIPVLGKYNYNVYENLDLYGKAGLALSISKANPDNYDSKTTVNVSPVVGAGLEYKIYDNTSLLLDYTWTNEVHTKVKQANNSTTTIKPNNGMLSLGVNYSFGSLQSAAPDTVESIIEEEVSYEITNLKTKSMFANGGSQLTVDDKLQINNFVNEITQLNPNAGAIMVVGYASKTGQVEYNLKLSKERAEAVKDYLVSLGIDGATITTYGEGETDKFSTTNPNENRTAIIEAKIQHNTSVQVYAAQ